MPTALLADDLEIVHEGQPSLRRKCSHTCQQGLEDAEGASTETFVAQKVGVKAVDKGLRDQIHLALRTSASCEAHFLEKSVVQPGSSRVWSPEITKPRV